MPTKRPSASTFARRLRKQRENAFWEWTLDLTGLRTESQFTALAKEHLAERKRAGFIRDLRIQAGSRFWAALNWDLACYFGNIHVRVRDWAGFQQRLPATAKKLQTTFRQLRGERGAAGFRVDYDSAPTSGVRYRTYIRYFFVTTTCNLTIDALAAALRTTKSKSPLTVLSRTWPALEFDFGLETRTLPKSPGLEVRQGGHTLNFVLNANARRTRLLLDYLADTGVDHDEFELRGCSKVLEAWTEEPDRKGTLSRSWRPVVQFIEKSFPGALIEQDDPLE